MTADAAIFETHRRLLTGIAYRMLGSVAAAQDVVQDAFLRWHRAAPAELLEPKAYLTRIVTRLCLDVLKSARVQRETYVGRWLPEPMIEPLQVAPATGADLHALAQDLSVALLVTLEQLSPLERAAFLLRDVFDMDFAAVADVLNRSEAACRQLAGRARDHLRENRPRFTATPQAEARLAAAFAVAMYSGDTEAIAALLADDAVVYTDGGGQRLAALRPIFGRIKIQRFFAGLQHKRQNGPPLQAVPGRINGLPGFVLRDTDGVSSLAIACHGDAIAAMYVVRNPDKLQHLQVS